MHPAKPMTAYILLLCLLLTLILPGCQPAPGSSEPVTIESTAPAETTDAAAQTTATTVQTSATAATPTPEPSPSPSPTPSPTPAPTARPTAPATPAAPAALAALHQNALVIDTHNDTVLKIIDRETWLPKVNISAKTSLMVDLPKLVSGGIDVATFAAYTSGYSLAGGGQDFAKANSRLLALLNAVHWTLRQNAASTRQILQYSDIATAADSGKTGILLSIEGAYSLHGDTAVELLRQYRDLGVRMLAPVWSNSNALGEGVNEKYKDGTASGGGLTAAGLDVLAEMNRLGMVIDVSHMNEETFWATLAASRAPVIASHSSAAGLCPNVRNLTDSQILAIAANGGVVQVNFHRPFLAVDESTVTLGTLVDHIDYIAGLAGIDHVGLGSDFDGADMPQGLPDASAYPRITQELARRGYSETDIRKILGLNIARVLEQVWAMSPWALSPQADSGKPAISPDLAMGAGLGTATPTLAATLADPAAIDPGSLQVIVDGVVYVPDYDQTTGTLRLTLTAALPEKFHVVTFSAAGTTGSSFRETRIFYID